jgi:hypothetical protein
MKNLSVLMLVLMMVSCTFESHDMISGNGKIRNKVLSTDTIRRIDVSDKLDVILIPSDSLYIILKADENLHEYISAEVNGETMTIKSSKNIRMARAKEVWVYTRYFNTAVLSSRASFDCKDSVIMDEFSLRASSGSDAKLIGRFRRLEVEASSGSNVNIEGKTDYLNAKINSAADLYAFDLVAKSADVISSAAADARVNVTEEAQFNATSAADIKYRGEPKIINAKVNSFGDVKKSKY